MYGKDMTDLSCKHHSFTPWQASHVYAEEAVKNIFDPARNKLCLENTGACKHSCAAGGPCGTKCTGNPKLDGRELNLTLASKTFDARILCIDQGYPRSARLAFSGGITGERWFPP